jgi:tetratricopeptide (TPR) repeat protein
MDWIAASRDSFSAWTGDPDIARGERLLARARAESDYQTELNVSGWLARCAFAEGRFDEAVRRSEEPWLRYYAEVGSPAWEFAMVARFALHARQADKAKHVLELVGDMFGGVIDHDRANVRAGVAALEGRVPEALGLYRSALAGYRDAGCRFDVALTVLDMAALIGPDEPAVRAAIPEGREILVGLGARPLIERLDALADEGGRERDGERRADEATPAAERTTAQPTG